MAQLVRVRDNMEAVLGMRVVGAPDWCWDNQDGGEGYVGTLVKLIPSPLGECTAVVAWDNGVTAKYQLEVGYDAKYVLRILDSGPAGIKHNGIACSSCDCTLYGIRWKCTECDNVDLCTKCYMSDEVYKECEFVRIERESTQSVRVPCRSQSKKMMSKGMFEGAYVVAHRDWPWENEEGGPNNYGVITEMKGCEDETDRSIVEVAWYKYGRRVMKRNCRIGHKGKIDLKCIIPADGGYFYPDHLPVLGAAAPLPETTVKPQHSLLAPGDYVQVQLEVDAFKALQGGDGGWNESMADIIGSIGILHSLMESGDMRVEFWNHYWTVKPAALHKVANFKVNDVVKVISDAPKVRTVQKNHGQWSDDMALCLGHLGRITSVHESGDVRVDVNGASWTFNPLCLLPAPWETPPDVPVQQKTNTKYLQMCIELLSQLNSPAFFVVAAAINDASTLPDAIIRNLQDVDSKTEFCWKCIDLLKSLSDNTEIPSTGGDHRNSDETNYTEVVLQHSAECNSKSSKENASVIIAAAKGESNKLLQMMSQHPGLRLVNQGLIAEFQPEEERGDCPRRPYCTSIFSNSRSDYGGREVNAANEGMIDKSEDCPAVPFTPLSDYGYSEGDMNITNENGPPVETVHRSPTVDAILKHVYNQNHYYQQEFETVKQMAERFHASTESLDHKNKELQQKISQIKEEVEKEIGASLINLQIKLANIRKDFECVVRNEPPFSDKPELEFDVDRGTSVAIMERIQKIADWIDYLEKFVQHLKQCGVEQSQLNQKLLQHQDEIRELRSREKVKSDELMKLKENVKVLSARVSEHKAAKQPVDNNVKLPPQPQDTGKESKCRETVTLTEQQELKRENEELRAQLQKCENEKANLEKQNNQQATANAALQRTIAYLKQQLKQKEN